MSYTSSLAADWLRKKSTAPYFAAYRRELLNIADEIDRLLKDYVEAKADAESWRKQNEDRVADCVRFIEERDTLAEALRLCVVALESELDTRRCGTVSLRALNTGRSLLDRLDKKGVV